jgi:hypothetical protein
MPRAAAATWTSVPVPMPSVDTSPAVRPWSMLRATMYRTAGPGVASRITAAIRNSVSIVGSGNLHLPPKPGPAPIRW